MNKTELRQEKTMLMALRCQFIDGMSLTKKGRGLFSAKQWRLYHEIQCFFNKRYRTEMIEFLRSVKENIKRKPVIETNALNKSKTSIPTNIKTGKIK